MPKLVINTKKSCYEPFEVVINGKSYVLEMQINRSFISEFEALSEGVDDTFEIQDKQLDFLFSEPPEAEIKEMDIREKSFILTSWQDYALNFNSRVESNKKKGKKL